jgi:hypothetical protein
LKCCKQTELCKYCIIKIGNKKYEEKSHERNRTCIWLAKKLIECIHSLIPTHLGPLKMHEMNVPKGRATSMKNKNKWKRVKIVDYYASKNNC